MAGIGFQLHKLIEDESFLNKAKAYIFASIITSGPWILSIFCLALLGIFSAFVMISAQFRIISITIVYSFAFSIIITGPVQFVLTRYLADKEYLKQKDKMFPSLVAALLMSLLLALALSIPWYVLTQGSFIYKLLSVMLFVILCSIWTMMDFLSCLKQYQNIIISFGIGSLLSVVLLLIFGYFFQLEGGLLGYTAGQAGILIMLIINIAKEFSFKGFHFKEFLKYFTMFPFILFTGLFYNLGLWIDKLIGWFLRGQPVFGNFMAYNIYDVPIFIAYLSIIPSLAYFLIQSETKFYLVHRNFFDSITREPLDKILQYKENLIKTLKKSILKLAIVQIITSCVGFALADLIGGLFNFSPLSIIILRILFFAAAGQVLFLYVIIFLMYFDLSRVSFYMVLFFFVLNLGLNLLLINYPQVPMGAGYLISIVLSFGLGLILLLRSVTDIEYKIFMRQEN